MPIGASCKTLVGLVIPFPPWTGHSELYWSALAPPELFLHRNAHADGVLGGRRSKSPEEMLIDWRRHGITATTYMCLQPTGNHGSDVGLSLRHERVLTASSYTPLLLTAGVDGRWPRRHRCPAKAV